MSIGDRLRKRLEELEKKAKKPEERIEEQIYEQLMAQKDKKAEPEQVKTDSEEKPAEQSYEKSTEQTAEHQKPEVPAVDYKKPEQPAAPKKISVGEQLARRGIQSPKTLEEEVAELIEQANKRTCDSEDITRWKEGMPIYITTMPAITYDHVVVILNGELSVYKDVHEGEIDEFEKLVLLEREWKSTRSQQKREEFYFAVMQLQEEYKPEYTRELALAYLRRMAKGGGK